MNCERLKSICKRYGHSPLSYLTLNPRLSHFTRPGADGYIAWGKAGRTAVALTDPITSVEDLEGLTGAFRMDCEARDEHVVFFGATGRFDRELVRLGYHRYILGRDAVLDAAGFSLKGNRMQNIRRGCNHARNVGLEAFELKGGSGADMKAFHEIHDISRKWLRLKRTPEIEHIVWKLDSVPNPDLRYFIARSSDRLEAFVTFNPIYPTGDWYLDLTRRRVDAPNGVLDYLIVESLKVLRAEGMRKLYLGMVPDPKIHRQMYPGQRIMKGMMRLGAQFSDLLYPVKSEHFFKEKYQPRWKENFIFSADRLTAWRLYDILEFVQPEGLAGILRHKVAAAIF